MLAVVKEPHIEISLGGEASRISEFIAFIRTKYTVDILTNLETSDDDELVDITQTESWRKITSGDILSGYRLKHELTQEQLSQKCGIHQVVLSAYETGKRKITRKAIYKIAQALNENAEEIFRRIAERTES